MTCLRSPDENHFANSPQSSSPSNVYRSIDCNEILEKELEKLDESENRKECAKASKFLVSQSSIEIDIGESLDQSTGLDEKKTESEKEYLGEVSVTGLIKYSNQILTEFHFFLSGMDTVGCTFWCATI